MRDRVQIDRFAVRNYRSIQECEVTLSPLTFFIGANGSGKSSIVDAMRFMPTALTSSLSNAVVTRGGAYTIFHRPLSLPTSSYFDFFLSSAEGLRCEFHLELHCTDGSSVSVSYEECRIKRSNGERHHYLVRDGKVTGSSPVFPSTSMDRVYLANASGLPEFRWVFDYFTGLSTTEPTPPQVYQLAQQLNARARRFNPNYEETSLANSFKWFIRNQPDRLEIVHEYLRAIAPSFDRINVEEVAGEPLISFVEKSALHGAMPFYLNQASSGIVNSAEILLELFRLPPDNRPPGTLIIEEPEAHLHPGAVQVVRDACLEASKFRQVLVTTHSPELLDDPSVPADWIRTVYKDETGTHVDSLDAKTDSIIRDQLYTAGQLLRQGGLIHRS